MHRLKTKKQTDGLLGETNIMDTIMDRDTRHKKLMALSNQHRELDKAKPQAVEYPHVYGAPTGGNILDAFGKKYALPLGTERHLEDVFAFKTSLTVVLRRNHCSPSTSERKL
jgi:hypothetical protein